jgi:hypothetical protein
MKRISLVAALLGAVVLAFAGVAMAGTSTPGNSYGTGTSGNGTSVLHYDTTYTDYFFGPVECIGVQQVKKNQPVQDSFTCTSTSNAPLTSVQPGELMTLANIGGWQSDAGHAASGLAKTFNATVSSDGMSYTAVATY